MFEDLCSSRENFVFAESAGKNVQSVDGAGGFDGGSEDLPPPN